MKFGKLTVILIVFFKAKDFSEEMEQVLVRLGQIEGMLITSRPVGGLPETAKEQLERFLVGGVINVDGAYLHIICISPCILVMGYNNSY